MKFAKGQAIYRQSEPSNALYLITAGQVGLVVHSLATPTQLATLGPGQVLGDLGFFSKQPRTSDAIALTEVKCVRVDYNELSAQLGSQPKWFQILIRTLSAQVQAYASEIKPLRDHDDGGVGSRLIVARAWAALTLIPHQYGEHDGDVISIDWPTLRTFSNLCFREISHRTLQLATALEPHGFCKVHRDATGPIQIDLLEPEIMNEFLTYYTRAITTNSPELSEIRPIENATLNALARPDLEVTPIHRGQVEINLVQFGDFARRVGYPEVTATSVDLLKTYGVDIAKHTSEDCVHLRFHQEEVRHRAKFWQILKIIRDMDPTRRSSGAA